MSGLTSNASETILVKMTMNDCADYCAVKLKKLMPSKKVGALNGIKNAFNFKADINDEQAERIYEMLKNRKVFLENGGKIVWA